MLVCLYIHYSIKSACCQLKSFVRKQALSIFLLSACFCLQFFYCIFLQVYYVHARHVAAVVSSACGTSLCKRCKKSCLLCCEINNSVLHIVALYACLTYTYTIAYVCAAVKCFFNSSTTFLQVLAFVYLVVAVACSCYNASEVCVCIN